MNDKDWAEKHGVEYPFLTLEPAPFRSSDEATLPMVNAGGYKCPRCNGSVEFMSVDGCNWGEFEPDKGKSARLRIVAVCLKCKRMDGYRIGATEVSASRKEEIYGILNGGTE